MQFLFDTLKDLTILPCGHTMHMDCLKEMEQHHRYSCPVCSKSVCDLSDVWRKLDHEVAFFLPFLATKKRLKKKT